MTDTTRTARNIGALPKDHDLTPRISAEEYRAVATEIYRQLGGQKFKVMTGAHNLFSLDTTPDGGLQLDFKGSRKANRLRVILDPMDTYTVEFYRLGRDFETWSNPPVKVYEGVYNDMLQDIFTSFTGLDTHL